MMIRPFTLFCVILAGVSGMILYTQKHKTTMLDHQIAKIVYNTEKIKARTAMLRTEWTLLNQPDRLKGLANNFLPQLQPLAPTQFVQMAALPQHLPPVKKEQIKDKTRENLAQAVASNHEEREPSTQLSQHPIERKEKTAALANNDKNQSENEDSSSDLVASNKDIAPQIENEKEINFTPKSSTSKPSTSHNLLAKKTVKPATHPKQDDEDITDNTMIPQKKLAKNTYSEQNSNIKPHHHSNFSIADNTNASIAKTKENDRPSNKKNQTSKTSSPTSVKSKQTTPLKMARYEVKKKSYHSDSAFGDDGDDLPAPVPFSH